MMKRSLLALISLSLFTLSACTSINDNRVRPQTRIYEPASPPLMGQSIPIPSKGAVPSGAPIVKVALLIPLAGESVAIGNAMLDAANMAIHDIYMNAPSDQIQTQIVLLPKDTGTTPADSRQAAKQAIDQGANIIIGPLFSQSVAVMAPMTKEADVTVISFSNNQAVASENVYTFGFLPEQQVARIAEYAYLHNIQRVAVLAPNDTYGEKIQQTLKQEFFNRGGLVSPSELYAPSPANINAAVSRLASAYSNASDERKFQAIFIADGGRQLSNIINSLKRTDIDLSKIKLLGTGLWDDPQIANMPEMHGAWFPSAPTRSYKKFEQHFTAVYGYKPIRLASLAYDAVALVTSLTMSSSDGKLSKLALTDPNGYVSPANSLFRLRPSGISERKLAIMEVTPEGFKIIDFAPKTFVKP